MPSVDVALRRAEVAAAPASRDVGIARIDIFDDIAAAAPAWDRLADGAIATPFGRRDWIELWQRHIGERSGTRPLIAVARDARDEPLFLLPLAARIHRLFTVAHYFGGRHSQLNMGLWRPDVAAALTAADLAGAFATIAQRGDVDLFLLLNQPATWDGRRNPLALLAHQPSPDDVFRVDFAGERGDDVIKSRLKPALRGILKSKEKKLAKLAGYRYFRAASADEAERLLAAFLIQKAAHLKAQGVRNAFAAAGVADFLRAATVDALAAGAPVIELHAIEGDGEVLAVMGGVANPARFSCMFNSYTLGDHARWSPGLILIQHMLRHCADRAIASFDLGAGFAPYKRYFCKTIDPLFDTMLAFSERGHIAAAVCRTGLAGKRWIKSTGPLWAVVRAARRITSR
ncbi:MAG TPA: GNAT family N-acetyltransferase [Xanthobacteraceae bacterium]|nr:GNAT family N-acetyltransferase [Xanthobacteraceae bacterium]